MLSSTIFVFYLMVTYLFFCVASTKQDYSHSFFRCQGFFCQNLILNISLGEDVAVYCLLSLECIPYYNVQIFPILFYGQNGRHVLHVEVSFANKVLWGFDFEVPFTL